MAEPTHTFLLPLLILYALVCYLYVFVYPTWRAPPAGESEPNDAEIYAHLTDQQRMERLVEYVERAEQFQDVDGAFFPVSEWPGVACANGEVTRISWNGVWSKVYLNDSIMDLWWLPPGLQEFDIGYAQVVGVFFAAKLPRPLRTFVISACQFRGTVDWAPLPEALEVLDVSNTYLEGCVRFDALPASLRQLRLQNTNFDDFSGIPRKTLTVVGISELERKAQAKKRTNEEGPFVL